MASNNKIIFHFTVDTSKLTSGLNKIDKGLKNVSNFADKAAIKFKHLSKQFSSTSKSSGILRKAFTALVGVQIGKWLAEGTKQAIDFTETMNLFSVAMKESRDVAYEFVDSISEMYGLDKKWLMDATGLFYEMAYAVNMPDEAARKFSMSLTALSVDLASLFNVDIETVSDNLISGMRGQSRAVLKYGMDLRATTVEQTALSLGIKTNYETMNEASREILRYITAVNQARDATGDFAKTVESPANQLRILKEQFIQLGRAIGNIFLGALAPILPVINGIIMAIRVMIELFSALLGIKYEPPEFEVTTGGGGFDPGQIASGVEDIGDAADKTKKKLQDMVAPFDELNIINEPQQSDASGGSTPDIGGGSWGSVDPKLLEALDANLYTLEKIRLKAQDTKEAILAFFGITPSGDSWVYSPELFEKNLKAKLPGWEKTISALFDADYSGMLTQLKAIWGTLKEIAKLTFSKLAEDFTAIFGVTPDAALAQFITDLPTHLSNINLWLQTNKETIAEVLARVVELYLAWQAFLVISPLISAAFSALSLGATIAAPLISALTTLVGPLSNAFVILSSQIRLFGAALTAPPVGMFNGQIATGSTLSAKLTAALGKLALNMSGPLAAGIGAIVIAGAALFVGGFIEWAKNSEEFKATLDRIFTALGQIFENLGIIFGKIVEAFVAGCQFMSTNFGYVYDSIMRHVGFIVDILNGLITFIAGVFEGNWKKALNGLGNVFIAFLNMIGNSGTAVVNTIITVINKAVDFIVNGIIDGINALISGIAGVLAFIGVDLSVRIPEVPPIPLLTFTPIPSIPMATGGIATGPTRALIGEGAYEEAVIPLGNSPQIEDMLQRFAEVSSASANSNPVEVRVFIGDKEWDSFTYQSAQRGALLVGASPFREDG